MMTWMLVMVDDEMDDDDMDDDDMGDDDLGDDDDSRYRQTGFALSSLTLPPAEHLARLPAFLVRQIL